MNDNPVINIAAFDFGKIECQSNGRTYLISRVRNNPHKDCSPSTVVIPSEIDGIRVVGIGKWAFKTFVCDELFLPDGIHLEREAFAYSNVRRIHIPGVDIIPARCFYSSSIEEVLDSGDVFEVEPEAFSLIRNSSKTFKWFPNAAQIPINCFRYSSLNEINGLEKVESIGICAFSMTQIKEIKLPSKCIVGMGCFDKSPIERLIGVEDLVIDARSFNNDEKKPIELPDCARLSLIVNSDYSYSFLYGYDTVVTIERTIDGRR